MQATCRLWPPAPGSLQASSGGLWGQRSGCQAVGAGTASGWVGPVHSLLSGRGPCFPRPFPTSASIFGVQQTLCWAFRGASLPRGRVHSTAWDREGAGPPGAAVALWHLAVSPVPRRDFREGRVLGWMSWNHVVKWNLQGNCLSNPGARNPGGFSIHGLVLQGDVIIDEYLWKWIRLCPL